MRKNGVSFYVLNLEIDETQPKKKETETDMNKALHIFVYLFLILTGVAFYFAYQGVYKNKEEMSDRNKALRDTIIEATAYIERSDDYNSDAQCPEPGKYKLDVSPTTAEWSENYTDPESNTPKHTKSDVEDKMKDVLSDAEDWSYNLEKSDNKPIAWGKNEREELRSIYELDPLTGKPLDDGTGKMTADSTAMKRLRLFVDALKVQKEQLAKTREAIPSLRSRIEDLVFEINDLKPQLRNERATVVARDATIKNLNDQKTKLESEIVDHKATIEQQKTEIFSLRDEVTTSRQETEAAKEELAAEKEMVANLKKMIQDLRKSLVSTVSGSGSGELGEAVTSVPAGDKGKIVVADNEAVYAIIEVTPEAMKELKGNDLMRPLPILEFAVKRSGFNGPAGEIVGRVRLRQEVAGKNWIVCDILANWSQDSIRKDDVVFAD